MYRTPRAIKGERVRSGILKETSHRRLVVVRRGPPSRQLIGDTTYGTLENIVVIEDEGIRPYVPLPDFDCRTPVFGKGEFAYDAARAECRYPQEQPLIRLKTKFTEQEVVNRAEATTCNACPRKSACTESDCGRSVHRSFFVAYLDNVRGYHETGAYGKAMRKRRAWVEADLTAPAPVACEPDGAGPRIGTCGLSTCWSMCAAPGVRITSAPAAND